MEAYNNERVMNFLCADKNEKMFIVTKTPFKDLTSIERTYYYRNVPLTEMSEEGLHGWASRQVANWSYKLTDQERIDIMNALIESTKAMAIKCQQTKERLAYLEEARIKRKEAEEKRREEKLKERARVTTITMSDEDLNNIFNV